MLAALGMTVVVLSVPMGAVSLLSTGILSVAHLQREVGTRDSLTTHGLSGFLLVLPKGRFRTTNSTAPESVVFCYRRRFLLSLPLSCLFFLVRQAFPSTLRTVCYRSSEFIRRVLWVPNLKDPPAIKVLRVVIIGKKKIKEGQRAREVLRGLGVFEGISERVSERTLWGPLRGPSQRPVSEPVSECHFPLTVAGPVAPNRVAP